MAEALAGLDRGAEAAAAGAEAAQIFESVGQEADAAVASYWLAAGELAQGNAVEAESILKAILARVRGGLRVEPDFELRLIMALSSTASRDGRHSVALAYLEEVRGLADALDDHRRRTFLFDLAYSYRERGDFEAAIRTGIASLALFRATIYELGSASLENDLALSFLVLGNVARADEFAAHYDLADLVPSPFVTRYAGWARAGSGAPAVTRRRSRHRGRRPALLHFLRIHNRRSGRLDILEFDDAAAAVAVYGDVELEHLDDRHLEIVLVGADSLDTVRQTHGHYFSTRAPQLPDLAGT